MKVAVVGSRSLGREYYRLLEEHIPAECSEVISGGAAGVDRLAREYAESRNISLVEFLPDYKSYERSAPIVRNAEIVARADLVLIFWDGCSKGSRNVIMTCINTHKPYRVILCNGGQTGGI
ncbi:MAG: DUF2493 domain-containing protein [Oscillospiraceae bacterium]|jgi:hypothetical protein|nr:DUF2493 domain-containing protein [Oscillospiraceae bacterium]